jgi:hypothetical protein
VIGYRGSDISALAQAALQPDSTFSCVVCVLSTYEGQNGDLSVTTGGVAINGATTVGPNGSIVGSAVGLAVPPGSNDIKGTVTPAPDTIPPFDDPLKGLPLPGRANFATSTAVWPALGTVAVNPPANGVCTPVTVYRTVNGCTSMSSGVYVVTQGSKLAGNGNLIGTGLLLFFGCEDSAHKWVLCSSGSVDKQGTISDAGNGVYTITSMSTGSYAGLTVVFGPDNTATYSQVGNGQSTLGGGLYGAKVTLDNRGTGAGQHCDDVDPFNDKGCPMAVNGVVVVGKVVFKGGDALKVTYNGSGESLDGPDALRLIR